MLPRSLNHTMAKLRELFNQGLPLTANDVESRLFIDSKNGREYLKILKAEGAIFIANWRRDSMHGPWTPVFRVRLSDSDRDAVKPPRMTAAESRRRLRAQDGNWQHELKLARTRRAGRKFAAVGLAAIKMDPLMSALHRDDNIAGL